MLIFEYGLILLIAVLLSNLINRFIPFISVPIIQIIHGVLVGIFPFGAFGYDFELEPELFFTNQIRTSLWYMQKFFRG